MYGYIARDKEELGLVTDIVVVGHDVRFVAKVAIDAGAYDLHLFGGDVLALRLTASTKTTRDGEERFACVGELAAKTVKYRRAPGPKTRVVPG